MKRILVFVLLFSGANALAQGHSSYQPEESVRSIHIAPAAGLNFVRLSGTEFESKTGFSGGMLTDLGGGYLQLQTGFMYNQFNQLAKYDSDLFDNQYRLQLNYISVPVLAKINLMGNAVDTLFVKAGLMPSVLISRADEAQYLVKLGDEPERPSVSKAPVLGVAGLGGAISVNRKKDMAVLIEGIYMTSVQRFTSPDLSGELDGFAVNGGILIAL